MDFCLKEKSKQPLGVNSVWIWLDKGRVYEFNALTLFQISLRSFELHISSRFPHSWLSWYPCPGTCVHNNRGEFTGWEFQPLLQLLVPAITLPTSSRKPTANAICECMHKTVRNILFTIVYTTPYLAHWSKLVTWLMRLCPLLSLPCELRCLCHSILLHVLQCLAVICSLRSPC